MVRPPQRQLTLDEIVAVPVRPELRVIGEALPLARQLELMARAIGPESERIAQDLVELLEGEAPIRPRRVA